MSDDSTLPHDTQTEETASLWNEAALASEGTEAKPAETAKPEAPEPAPETTKEAQPPAEEPEPERKRQRTLMRKRLMRRKARPTHGSPSQRT